MPIDFESIPGSKWWKCDFHAHTPASQDHQDKPAPTPSEWLLAYMRAEVDCVAVTDHNSIGWLVLLQDALATLERDGNPEFRPLVLFPGFELSVNGGYHILGIFDPGASHEEVSRVVGACGYDGAPGDSDTVTQKSVQEVIKIVSEKGGLAIPAHVDDRKGLWGLEDHNTMKEVLSLDCLYSVEKKDLGKPNPALVGTLRKELSYVVGSDCHRLDMIGQEFCWVKMAEPNKEGLRLALLDGDLAVRRYDQFTDNPNNIHSSKYIERVEIKEAQFIGRGDPYEQALNPWMNSIIGGRGTGKSSFLEFIRIGCCRDSELNDYEKLAEEFSKYIEVRRGRGRSGLCRDETVFRVYYRSIGELFRIEYFRDGRTYRVCEQTPEGEWEPLEGQDIAGRFPIQVYSQKQIYQIAEHPQALRKIVDDSQAVARNEWEDRWQGLYSDLTVLSERIRSVASSLEAEGRLRGELADIGRQLALFENDENAETLKSFQLSKKQLLEVERWIAGYKEISDAIKEAVDSIKISPFAGESFDPGKDKEFLKIVSSYDGKLVALKEAVGDVHKDAEKLFSELNEAISKSDWSKLQEQTTTKYTELVKELEEQGVENPDVYNELVEAKSSLESRLKGFEEDKAKVEELTRQRDGLLGTIRQLREKLTEKRIKFLEETVGGNEHVRITITPYGDLDEAVSSFRDVLRLEEGPFKERILDDNGQVGLLNPLYDEDGKPVDDFHKQLVEMKERVKRIWSGDEATTQDMDTRFVNRLQKMNHHDILALECWCPEDALEVSYKSEARGAWESISQGSPGQKTAAILAFLLSYGDEPLLLDQPEDDLDNQLIFSLIVKQLIANKPRRQLIIVTHNPNIVVNGDSELIIALESRRGQTNARSTGGLQEPDVRSDICRIMEGGEKAFEKRYRRIIKA